MRRFFRRVFRPLAPLGSLLKEAFDSAWAHNISRMAGSIAYFGAFSLAPMIVIIISLASLVFGKSADRGSRSPIGSPAPSEQTATFIQSMLAAIYSSSGLDVGDRPRRPGLAVGVDPDHRLDPRSAQRHLGSAGQAEERLPGLCHRQAHRRRHGDRYRLHVPGVDVRHHRDQRDHHLLLQHPPPARLAPAGLRGPLLPGDDHAFPDRHLPGAARTSRCAWLHILVGASITAVLFSVGNYFIGRYLGRTSPGSAFGAAGSLAVIMIWIYYVAYIIIFGAEVTRAYAHRASVRMVQAAAAEAARGRGTRERPRGSRRPDEPGRFLISGRNSLS